MTFKKDVIAPCGMNCGICTALLRKRKPCRGCRATDEGKPVTRVECRMKTCEYFMSSKADFCYECNEYPCDKLKRLDKRYRTKYNMSMIENLKNIYNFGIMKFIDDEQTRWKCPECRSVICVHTGKCSSCGQEINEIQQ